MATSSGLLYMTRTLTIVNETTYWHCTGLRNSSNKIGAHEGLSLTPKNALATDYIRAHATGKGPPESSQAPSQDRGARGRSYEGDGEAIKNLPSTQEHQHSLPSRLRTFPRQTRERRTLSKIPRQRATRASSTNEAGM